MEFEPAVLQAPWHCLTLDQARRRRFGIGSQRSSFWALERRAKETGTSGCSMTAMVKELAATLVPKWPRVPRKCGNVEGINRAWHTVLVDVPVVRENHRSFLNSVWSSGILAFEQQVF